MDKYNNFEWNNFAKLFDIENRYYFVQTSGLQDALQRIVSSPPFFYKYSIYFI